MTIFAYPYDDAHISVTQEYIIVSFIGHVDPELLSVTKPLCSHLEGRCLCVTRILTEHVNEPAKLISEGMIIK